MKQFNLLAFEFAYTLFNNGTLQKQDEQKTMVMPNDKGMLTLEAASDVTINKKKIAKGKTVVISLDEVNSWVEENEWVDVIVPEDEKSAEVEAFKKKLKELREVEKQASQAALDADDATFIAKRQAWKEAKLAIEEFEKTAPVKIRKNAKKVEIIVFTDEEKKLIEVYEAAKLVHKEWEETGAPLILALNEAKKALPEKYKVKGTNKRKDGERAPKMTAEIRAKMLAFQLDGDKSASAVAREFGYSPQYATVGLKKAIIEAEATKADKAAEAAKK